MGQPKKKNQSPTASVDPAATEPAVFAGPYGGEVMCSKCSGMVNFNGCAEQGCPVASTRKG